MKPLFSSFIALSFTASAMTRLSAQTLGPQIVGASPSESNPTAISVSAGAWQLSAEQLDQLLGPIALYPDALIALILPAATVPSDVVLAGRYLAGEGVGPPQIDDQSWDDSVKALAHYPTVVTWMDQNLAWTKQLGEAFIAQPAEVMKSIQRLRSAARAAGTLVDTPQQQVITQSETISIVPADRDVIYVPYYDPDMVYIRRPGYLYGSSFFSFSVGYPVGFWLGYNLDWQRRNIWIVDRHERERYWREQRDWRRPSFAVGSTWTNDTWRRPWTPNPNYVRPPQPQYRRSAPVVTRPTPIVRDMPGRTLSSRTAPAGNEGMTSGDSTTSSSTQGTVYSRSRNYQPGPPAAPQVQASVTPLQSTFSAPVPAAAQTTTSTTPIVRRPPAYTRGERNPPPSPSQATPPASEQRSREPREVRGRPDVPRAPSSSSGGNVRSSAAPAPAPAPTSAPAAATETAQPAARASSSTPAPSAPAENTPSAPTIYSRGSR
ncbi:MAG: DUF3300 domain-containing protein [Opitutaceae bacterium]